MLFSLLLLVIIDVCHIVQVCLDKLLRLERSAFCNFILAVIFAYSLLWVSLIQNWGAQKNLEIVFYSIIIASYELFLSSDQIFSLCMGIKTIAISALAFHRKETELEKTFWLMVLVYLEFHSFWVSQTWISGQAVLPRVFAASFPLPVENDNWMHSGSFWVWRGWDLKDILFTCTGVESGL